MGKAMAQAYHRRIVSKALELLQAPADIRDQILDHFDAAVTEAHASGHNACADKVLAHLSKPKNNGTA